MTEGEKAPSTGDPAELERLFHLLMPGQGEGVTGEAAPAPEPLTGENCRCRVLEDGTMEILQYTGNAMAVTVPAALEGKRVTRIGPLAFAFCPGLAAVELPHSLTAIGDRAFSGRGLLASLTLPASLTAIGADAFAGCPALTLTVSRGSYAESYCRDNGLKYTYPDALDWLNE